MRNFEDFYLKGNLGNLSKFKNQIGKYVDGDWKINDNSRFKDDFVVFKYNGTEVNKANVFLYTKNNSEFSITNIVPVDKNSLDYDEYNEILEKCIEECIGPCAKDCDLTFEILNKDVDLENYMSIISAKKLRVFSSAANKSTGSGHPCDQERWHDFICQTFADGYEHVTSILGRWLVEEDGWSDDRATDLVIEFEQGTALLEFYRKKYHD